MGHNQGTHQTCRNTPRGSPYIIKFIILIYKLYVKSLSEVLSQEMRSTTLQSLSVLSHRLNGISIKGTGKTFRFRFNTSNNRNSHVRFYKVCIYSLHLLGLRLCLLSGSMSRVPLLPKKF